MHEAGDAGGDRVVFDAGEPAGSRSAAGSRAKNRPVPMPGSSTRPPVKPRRWAARQSATDDRLRRVVRILRRALQGGVFLRRDGGFERRADLLPAGAEFGPRRAAESSSAPVRWRRSRRSAAAAPARPASARGPLLQLLRQPDRGDVVARPGGPAAGERAITVEMEVAAARGRGNRTCRRRRRVVVVSSASEDAGRRARG